MELSPWLSKRKRERRTENLITRVVTFHKAQCYFASIIQIAGLVLAHDSLIGDASLSINGGTNLFHDFVDTSVLVVLATSGFIPIRLTLAVVTHHEPQGWYLLILSLMTTLLATATLSASYFYANNGGAGNYYASSQDNVFQIVDGNPICSITGYVGDIIYPLCGTDSLNNMLSELAHSPLGLMGHLRIMVSILLLSKDVLQQRLQVTRRSTTRRFSKSGNVRDPQGSSQEVPPSNVPLYDYFDIVLRRPVLPFHRLPPAFLHLLRMVLWPDHSRHGVDTFCGRVLLQQCW